jgi:YD repeat-containing protein
MITTFTYDPLKGMTSQTGPDGVTLTYEYDDLGRLVRVKDHLGNLVKHYEYHYKQ